MCEFCWLYGHVYDLANEFKQQLRWYIALLGLFSITTFEKVIEDDNKPDARKTSFEAIIFVSQLQVIFELLKHQTDEALVDLRSSHQLIKMAILAMSLGTERLTKLYKSDRKSDQELMMKIFATFHTQEDFDMASELEFVENRNTNFTYMLRWKMEGRFDAKNRKH